MYIYLFVPEHAHPTLYSISNFKRLDSRNLSDKS
jgi:hypothetical protein